jgi:hypothetical protein
LIGIGVTESANRDELEDIVGTSSRVFSVSYFSELSSVSESVGSAINTKCDPTTSTTPSSEFLPAIP